MRECITGAALCDVLAHYRQLSALVAKYSKPNCLQLFDITNHPPTIRQLQVALAPHRPLEQREAFESRFDGDLLHVDFTARVLVYVMPLLF